MPFPLIDGVSFEDDLKTVAALAQSLPPEVEIALRRLFRRVEVVSSQQYEDVHNIKRVLLNSHHKDEAISAGLTLSDPSQAPEQS